MNTFKNYHYYPSTPQWKYAIMFSSVANQKLIQHSDFDFDILMRKALFVLDKTNITRALSTENERIISGNKFN